MEYPQLDLKNAKGPKAIIQTNHGDIEVQLFEKEAPMTVENFVRLAKKRLLRWYYFSSSNQ